MIIYLSLAIADKVVRATKFALAPRRVYHATLLPRGELCSLWTEILDTTTLFTFLTLPESNAIVLSLWHFP